MLDIESIKRNVETPINTFCIQYSSELRNVALYLSMTNMPISITTNATPSEMNELSVIFIPEYTFLFSSFAIIRHRPFLSF